MQEWSQRKAKYSSGNYYISASKEKHIIGIDSVSNFSKIKVMSPVFSFTLISEDKIGKIGSAQQSISQDSSEPR